jgi:hypothetical protein
MEFHRIKFTGWAFDAYPEMTSEEMAFHVKRHQQYGANFLWIGHNNPGEVDIHKVEPALSYAIYEALMNTTDPRHSDARAIADAQRRLLEVCRRHQMPVVFPIGYQIQMGEPWNAAHPEELRRTLSGEVINWGGVSACFYAPAYQQDVQRYYQWVAEEFVLPYADIIVLVNLADEPFGGDYSHYAEQAFHEKTGLTFRQALKGSLQERLALGEFQSNYIVEYARWSAEAWRRVCPDLPSTMSFCGHHGREENIMPAVTQLFAATPSYFQPCFDVYPRDGAPTNPIGEDDVTMLIIFLRQLAYLSRKHQRPYWLWTTGNSWGLGQNSADKANIADALANQFYAASTARENGGLLAGIAIWNYNVKQQGLYNDTNPIIYNPDDLFARVTPFLAGLREAEGEQCQRQAELALVTSKTFAHSEIVREQKCVHVKPFAFHNMHAIAKSRMNIVMDDSADALLAYYNESRADPPTTLLYLSDDIDATNSEELRALMQLSRVVKRMVVPQALLKTSAFHPERGASVETYPAAPDNLDIAFYEKLVNNAARGPYRLALGEIEMFYNITGRSVSLPDVDANAQKNYFIVAPEGTIRLSFNSSNSPAEPVPLNHHELCLAAPPGTPLLKILLTALTA